MRRRHFFMHHAYRTSRSADYLVNELHDVIDRVMEHAMDAAFTVADRVPWTADEITHHVEAFVKKHVPEAERCFEDRWDDTK